MFSYSFYDNLYRKAATARISLSNTEDHFVKEWLLGENGLLDEVKAAIDAKQLDYAVSQVLIFTVADMGGVCEVGGVVTPARQVSSHAFGLIIKKDREGILSTHFGRKSGEQILKCNQPYEGE